MLAGAEAAEGSIVRLPTNVRLYRSLIDASIGFKVQLPGAYRVVTNLLTLLSDGGLRPQYVWTTGFERSF